MILTQRPSTTQSNADGHRCSHRDPSFPSPESSCPCRSATSSPLHSSFSSLPMVHRARTHQPKSLRPIDAPPFISELWLTAFLFPSREEAILKGPLSLFPNPHEATSGACFEFYDTFMYEADESDRDFTRESNKGSNTTFILVQLTFLLLPSCWGFSHGASLPE